MKNFDYDYDYDYEIENISERIIKPEYFEIPEESIKIHSITNKEENEKGKELKNILKKLGKIIKECDYTICKLCYKECIIKENNFVMKNHNKKTIRILSSL